jgi:hypothetical protein
MGACIMTVTSGVIMIVLIAVIVYLLVKLGKANHRIRQAQAATRVSADQCERVQSELEALAGHSAYTWALYYRRQQQRTEELARITLKAVQCLPLRKYGQTERKQVWKAAADWQFYMDVELPEHDKPSIPPKGYSQTTPGGQKKRRRPILASVINFLGHCNQVIVNALCPTTKKH